MSIVFDLPFSFKPGVAVKNPDVCFEVDNLKDMANWQLSTIKNTYDDSQN
jgi:hypothetical protein